MPTRIWVAFGLLLALAARRPAAASPAAGLPEGYRLLYSQDFSKPSAIHDFVMADPRVWAVANAGDKPCLELLSQSKYRPPVRSPFNLAVIAGYVFGDFVMEVELLSTVPESPGQDMCICFAMQSPTRFYYAHLAEKADGHAHHNIFIVNDKPRTNIAVTATGGVKWGTRQWHSVRVERKIADGSIKVYFDGGEAPVLTASDRTFTSGHIGFGSFDDTGKIAAIKIWGPSAERKKADFYHPPPPEK